MFKKFILFLVIFTFLIENSGASYALRPVATADSYNSDTSIPSDRDYTHFNIADEYKTIEYENGIFSIQQKENGHNEIQTVKLKRFILFTGASLGLLALLNYITSLTLGKSILDKYIELYNAHSFIVSGLIASTIGALSELSGLYISDNPSQRHKIISRFSSIFLFRLFLLGPTASAVDYFIENMIPKASAASFLLLLRTAISMVHGIFMSSIVQIFIPYYYMGSYAQKIKKSDDLSKVNAMAESYTIKNQLKKTVNSIWARLAIVVTQHDIIQNIFFYQPAYKILSRFGIGFLIGLFRSWAVNRRSSELQAKTFAHIGLAASFISFIWGSKVTALVAVLISTAMYISVKLKPKNKSENLCQVLNESRQFISKPAINYVLVARGLHSDIVRIEWDSGKVSLVLNESYVERILKHKNRSLNIKNLASQFTKLSSKTKSTKIPRQISRTLGINLLKNTVESSALLPDLHLLLTSDSNISSAA